MRYFAGAHRSSRGQKERRIFEIAILLLLVVIVVPPERLPEVMRTAGKVLRELRLASNTVMRELTSALDDPYNPPPAARPHPQQRNPPPPPRPVMTTRAEPGAVIDSEAPQAPEAPEAQK